MMSNPASNLPPRKSIFILGKDGTSGKSIIKASLGNDAPASINQMYETLMITGVEYGLAVLDPAGLKRLTIYESGPLEYYRDLVRSYFKLSQGIIICCNLVKDNDPCGEISHILQYVNRCHQPLNKPSSKPPFPVVLVLTRASTYTAENRKITHEQIIQLAIENQFFAVVEMGSPRTATQATYSEDEVRVLKTVLDHAFFPEIVSYQASELSIYRCNGEVETYPRDIPFAQPRILDRMEEMQRGAVLLRPPVPRAVPLPPRPLTPPPVHHAMQLPVAVATNTVQLASPAATAARRTHQAHQAIMRQKATNATLPHANQAPISAASSAQPALLAKAENLCVICLDQKATHIMVPCGHQCVCESCGNPASFRNGCPMCRAAIQLIIRVYP